MTPHTHTHTHTHAHNPDKNEAERELTQAVMEAEKTQGLWLGGRLEDEELMM
jgi:hypothetical protein